MLTWPGDARVAIDPVKSMAEGDTSNVSLLHIGTHTATHIDAPRHFIPGAPGVDRLDPAVLIGQARLFQLPDVRQIDLAVLSNLDLEGVDRLLLGTRNSVLLKKQEMDPDFTYVSEEAAHFLVANGIKLIGIDYLSIERFRNEGHPTHKILLGSGMIIIEGLDLTNVPPGDYELLCLPLKIKDADGAPARVFLRELP